MQPIEATPGNRRTILIYSSLALATLLAPIGLWRLPFPFIRLMDAVYHLIPLLQLFVFCAAMTLTVVGLYTLYRARDGWQTQLPLLPALLVFFHYLAWLYQAGAYGATWVLADGAAKVEQLWDLVFYLYEGNQSVAYSSTMREL